MQNTACAKSYMLHKLAPKTPRRNKSTTRAPDKNGSSTGCAAIKHRNKEVVNCTRKWQTMHKVDRNCGKATQPAITRQHSSRHAVPLSNCSTAAWRVPNMASCDSRHEIRHIQLEMKRAKNDVCCCCCAPHGNAAPCATLQATGNSPDCRAHKGVLHEGGHQLIAIHTLSTHPNVSLYHRTHPNNKTGSNNMHHSCPQSNKH